MLSNIASYFLAAFVLLTPASDQTISGTLMAEGGELGCEHCQVTLLTNGGGRPVAMAYTDSGGHFSFQPVPAGSYVIHAEIEGFEEVNQPVDAGQLGMTANVLITVARKGGHAASAKGGIVNISEILDQYPKKAVEAFKKGEEYSKNKKDEQAMKSFETAIKIAPNFYLAHNELGILYKHAGRLDDAENEFLRAHDLNRTSIEPLLNLTALYIDENKPERAVSASEEACPERAKRVEGRE